MIPPKPPHRCVLPLLWRTEVLHPGYLWRCDCGRLRRLEDTHQPGRQRYRFRDVTEGASGWPAAV